MVTVAPAARGGFGQTLRDLPPARRETLIWICALIVVNQLGFGMIVPIVPLYARQFGVDEIAIGLTIAVYGLARFVVAVPGGRLADRRGRRQLLALGGMLTVLGNALCALAPSYEIFLAARFVAGAGASMVMTGGQTVVADISERSNRGRLMALYQGVFLFAVGVGPLPGGLLGTTFGLGAPFAANAALAAGVTALAWFRLPETRSPRPADDGRAPAQAATDATAGVNAPAEAVGASSPSPGPLPAPLSTPLSTPLPTPLPTMPLLEQLRTFYRIPGFALVGLVSFALFFTRTGALFNVVPLLGQERLGLSPAQIGGSLSLLSVIGLGLAYPAGVLVDRFGRKAVIVPATLISAVGMLLFAVAPSGPWFVAACVVWACSSGIGGAAPAAYAADIAPAGMTSAALGAYRSIAEVGYVAGPLILGALSDLNGPNSALVLAASLTVAAGAAFARFAPETGGAAPTPNEHSKDVPGRS